MKETAEAYLSSKVNDAAATVPPYFNESLHHSTNDAGTISDMKVQRIITRASIFDVADGGVQIAVARSRDEDVPGLHRAVRDARFVQLFQPAEETARGREPVEPGQRVDAVGEAPAFAKRRREAHAAVERRGEQR